ncbi:MULTISPECIES: alpha/beta hydrolase [unclassified Streptomyces]|uniref:alpha/beta hydrolase n=1 Tax=unclassified Streptomyces TaxID=2593676 RepID=UPI00381DD296
MRAVARWGALAGIGSLVLTAAASPAAPAAAAPGTTAAAGASPAPGPAALAADEARGTAQAAARAAASGIAFARCPARERLPEQVRCGTVEVPLDYADPAGPAITLTVSRIPATGEASERQGALVYNPGGPGASSTWFPLAGRLPAWERIARAYDMVGYAPRGVLGSSAPLSCQDPADFHRAPTAAPTHPSPSEKRERIARARSYAAGCARSAGAALAHYTSLNNARDLEVIRAALGEPGLTFMGASYGTYIGALYATLFPSQVRRMVFDSAVDPDPRKVWYRNNLAQSLAFEGRWADFRAWVARHDGVYGLGATPREVARSYDTARARLALEPAGGTVGPGELHAAFLGAAYYDDFWPRLAEVLSRYLKGDPGPLVERAAPDPAGARESENATAVYTAVECNDAPWPQDWAVWDRDNTRLARVAPFETWDNAWMNLPCAFWSAPRRTPLDVGTRRGALPQVLILAAERDAATPYAGARELQRRLRGAALVTEEDAGTHGIGGGANACVNGYMEDYLLTGKAPVRRASCAPHREPDPVSLDRRASGLGPPHTV